jgi:hypothetical protein
MPGRRDRSIRLLRLFTGAALLFWLALAAPDGLLARESGAAPCHRNNADPFDLYGETMRFQVLRNGAPVGSHVVNFRKNGSDLIVETRFDVNVEVLYIPVYRYEYRAVDTWRSGCLVAMQAWVNDDGARHRVDAVSDGQRIMVKGPDGEQALPPDIFPTHHWNAGVLGSDKVLNTITGRVAHVRILDQGLEMIGISGHRRPARRFAYTGDLRTEVWYDDQSRWVKMRFTGTDGSTIEYVCERCSREITASR